MKILLFRDRAETATTATSIRLDFVLDEAIDALQAQIDEHLVDRKRGHGCCPPGTGSDTTLGASAFGSSSLTRSNSGRPSLVSMKGMNTASKLRMPHSIAVICPLIQSRKMLLTATCPCRSAAYSCFVQRCR